MLSAKNRFHRRNHLNRVYRDGKSVRGGAISLKYRFDSKNEGFKVAVVVSKKVAKSAVVRNRIRRRVFEAVRLSPIGSKPGLEAVFGVFDKTVAEIPSEDLKNQISSLLAKAK